MFGNSMSVSVFAALERLASPQREPSEPCCFPARAVEVWIPWQGWSSGTACRLPSKVCNCAWADYAGANPFFLAVISWMCDAS